MKKVTGIIAALYLCMVASAAEATTIDFVRTGNILNFTVTDQAEHPFTSSVLTPAVYSSFTESTNIFGGTSIYAASYILAQALTTDTLRFNAYDSEGNVIGIGFTVPQLADAAPISDSGSTGSTGSTTSTGSTSTTDSSDATGTTDSTDPTGTTDSTGGDEDPVPPLTPRDGATPVPEPGTVALLGAGAIFLAFYRRRQ